MSHLKLYVDEDGTGWKPLDGQTIDETKQTVTATDAQPRRYALFGPDDYYVAPKPE